jgi:hypothetical protein
MKIRMREYWAKRKSIEKKGDFPAKKTNLSFLRDMRTNHKAGWTIEKANTLVKCIREQMADAVYGGYRFNVKLASKETGMSESSCQMMLNELKKADREGYTLESYFRAGRPLRTGAKVLA